MRNPFRFKRTVHGSTEETESIRSLFSKFRRILKLNNESLELMAHMERVLGGEFIYDRAFLERSVRTLSVQAYQVVYSLNALSLNRYVDLFDRYQGIRDILEDILNGGLGPFARSLTLPYSSIHWEMEPLVGSRNVTLAEAGHHLDLQAPDGFAVTTTGCRRFLEANGFWERFREDLPDSDRERFQTLAAEAPIPDDLQESLSREMEALFKRRGNPVSLALSICPAGHGGRTLTCGASHPVDSPDLLPTVFRRALARYLVRRAPLDPEEALPVAAVHERIAGEISGTIRPVNGTDPSHGAFAVTAMRENEAAPSEIYLLRRVYPFQLLRSEIQPKTQTARLPDGVRSISCTSSGMRRGSALLGAGFLKNLAEMAVTMERVLGLPQEIHWIGNSSGKPVILDVAAHTEQEALPDMGENLMDQLQSARELLRGGETAQAGVSVGEVVHVKDGDSPDDFPPGAVAVARQASPRLSRILRRAAALITEVGTSTGHLASIAREFRVPAIVGAPHALERLPQGSEVTVDAAECVVYEGILEPLLAYRASGAELYPTDPEYRMLRQLLRWVLPLHLIDPESPEFSVQNCSTYHDVIHFAHERAVEELINIQERHRNLRGVQASRLELEVPLDLAVLDIDGGLVPGASQPLSIGDVTSLPFRAFLDGLAVKEAWDRRPGPLTLRDIVSGLDRTYEVMNSPPEFTGRNLAIVAQNYTNVSLRLGYHFNVIDAFLCGNPNQNYIYFRFVGGFSEELRRNRRVELIRRLLETLSFQVTVKGDLVVGKLKIIAPSETSATLTLLGRMTGFTRQLDLSMTNDNTIDELVQRFMEQFMGQSTGKAPHRCEEEDGNPHVVHD